MANNNTLKSDIRQYIYSNQNEEITGNILRDVLLEMVDSLGDGWTYKGVATTSTNPGTPDDNVFYIATAPGTYTNFGGLSVADGEVAILKYNGSWAKDVTGAATSAQVTQLGQEVNTNKTNITNLQQEIDDIQPIIIEGNVTNAPDEEDITTDSNDLLKFANRPTAVNQMGYVILRKNKTFAEQVTQENTIYEIRYAFDLDGASVTIPNGCVLVGNGGTLQNGTVVLRNTKVIGNLFTNSISVSGTTTNKKISPTMFGAKCDGVTDDTTSIQKMMDFLVRTQESLGGKTGTTTNPLVVFEPGKYLITEQIVINSISHVIDFGKAIILASFDDYAFFSKAHNAVYSGGIFATKKAFKFNNYNIDQGKIIVKESEFKGNITSLLFETQSSIIVIEKCKFDNVLHPVYTLNATLVTFRDNWCQCPIPETDDSNFLLNNGIVHFENNVLTPIAGDGNGFGTTVSNPGTEVAWIENKANALYCIGNRFGDESAARTPINHKKKWTNTNFAVLDFSNNLVGDKISTKKSAIRLFTFPNIFIAKNNYKGEFVSLLASITSTSVTDFDADLQYLRDQFFSLKVGDDMFYNPQFRRFLFDVDNCFASNNSSSQLLFEREPEYTFLIRNYSRNLNLKNSMRFTGTLSLTSPNYQYVPVFSEVTTGTRSKTYHLPLIIATGAIVTVTFNFNTQGTSYRQTRRFFINRVRFYDYQAMVLPSAGVVGTYDVQEETISKYKDAIATNGNVEIGIYNNVDAEFFGEDIPLDTTNVIMGLAVKLSGQNVGTVGICVDSL